MKRKCLTSVMADKFPTMTEVAKSPPSDLRRFHRW